MRRTAAGGHDQHVRRLFIKTDATLSPETGRIGLIFVVPGQRETLRINGSATLSTDPALLERLGDYTINADRVVWKRSFGLRGPLSLR